jgi:uncharacterized membrane protein (UPF0127 family)
VRPHFLAEVADGRTPCGLRVERTGAWLITNLRLAGDSAERRRGLLDSDGLADGEGLVIAPSQGVHTFGMRFAIDVVGVARDGRVVLIRSAVRPRRIVLAWRAFAMVELSAGGAIRAGIRLGDRVVLTPLSA